MGKRTRRNAVCLLLATNLALGGAIPAGAAQSQVIRMGEACKSKKLEEKRITQESVTLLRGQSGRIVSSEDFIPVEVTVKIPNPNGGFVRNSGSSKIKRELQEGESDGKRTAGDADGSHIASASISGTDLVISAKEMGRVAIVATNAHGQTRQWEVCVPYEDPDDLPEASAKDYERIRGKWKESLVGINLAEEGKEGQTLLTKINQDAKSAWESYDYREMDSCPNIPWSFDKGTVSKENPNIPYEDDAVEFRPAFQRVLAMAKAYAAVGSDYYQNRDLLKDMIHILDYLCTVCYTPKSETDNWWTWEIGVPKDLVPALILIGDDLSEEQKERYTQGLYFFQPDPFHGGAIGTGSTHAQGYRLQQAANRVDCTRTALGIGLLREDNDLVNLALIASSEVFVVQQIADSTKLAEDGYESGFYADGSYLDHEKTPYAGSYGIEFLKGAAEFPTLLSGTPWEYSDEVRKNFEIYLKKGLLGSMYEGRMLDFLKGRSVSRLNASNQDAGREAMTIILRLMDMCTKKTQGELKKVLKAWMQIDKDYVESISGVENMNAKAKAREILTDDSIESVQSGQRHQNYPLMDRVIHQGKDYLVGVSMYSERIQNTEVMNHENRYGWFQGSGMTYLYNGDRDHYSDNFWNTVNPLRLAGTTVVSKNIGNGVPDSSGYVQGGDFCSPESWVGGSTIGANGINGMALSGKIQTRSGEGEPSQEYAPNFTGKKSWFFFGDQILCLGAGITDSKDAYPVESVIENRHLLKDKAYTFVVNGNERKLAAQKARTAEIVDGLVDVSGEKLENVSWAHLKSSESGADIGYYFPIQDQEIRVRKAKNTGDWSEVGTFEGEAEEEYLELWFDHGVNPTNASYAYVLLPGMSVQETKTYASKPQILILENTDRAQAAYSREKNLLGVNFWEDEKTTVGSICANQKASVLLEETEDHMVTIAVADPTMKNTESIVVEINLPVERIVHADKNVKVERIKDTGVRLTVHTEGCNGESSYANIQFAVGIDPQHSQQSQYTGNNLDDSGAGSTKEKRLSWFKEPSGWRYCKANGVNATDEWQLIDGLWYHFDKGGSMQTGWYQDALDGHWYYLDPATGSMQTGWITLEGKHYYLNPTVSQASWSFDEENQAWNYTEKGLLPFGAMCREEE